MTHKQHPGTGGAPEAESGVLKLEYEQICNSHQAITDFRGKLLGLLPLAAGTGIFLLLNKTTSAKNQTQVAVLLVAAGVFGAAVTIGLYFYERRGMIECHLLRTRGARLEHEMNLKESCSRFQGNPSGFVGPLGAGPIVYFAVVAGWVFVAVFGLSKSNPEQLKAIGILIFILYLLAIFGTFKLNKKKGLLGNEAVAERDSISNNPGNRGAM
jgi:divalent metal cation (Fe/Co/Zn/Cd) transporter